jgi:hypothetical protein
VLCGKGRKSANLLFFLSRWALLLFSRSFFFALARSVGFAFASAKAREETGAKL